MTGIPTLDLRPGYTISRIIRGGWQLAGGHGAVDPAAAVDDLMAYTDAGIFTFDCADIYTGVEDLIGAFRARYGNERGAEALAKVKVHTKLVPDLGDLARVDRAYVRRIVEQSLRRLKQERLDLVQFHWWDYGVPGYLEAAGWLDEMRREGKVQHVGGTNFDTPHAAGMLDAGIPLLSMQVQYSLLDARPQTSLVALARAHGMHLFCYGSVAGGFLSDVWLGQREPAPPLENRSLTKYKLIIDDFGGWEAFQALLMTLRAVADKYGTDIATIASSIMLERPGVAAVIVGARNRAHLAANALVGQIPFDDADRAAISGATAHATGPEGDTFALERDRTGRHGAIMKYNLNKGQD